MSSNVNPLLSCITLQHYQHVISQNNSTFEKVTRGVYQFAVKLFVAMVRGAQLKQAVSQEARKHIVGICLNDDLDFENLAILPENLECVDSDEAKDLESTPSFRNIRDQVIEEESASYKKAIIIRARYGIGSIQVDATQKVTELYNNGTKLFNANNGLVGDPASGRRKYLHIEWKYKGQIYSGESVEHDHNPIVLP